LVQSRGNLKQSLEGETQARQDKTPNVSRDIQKKIRQSENDPHPLGWEEINRDYFGRLSDGEGATPTPTSGAAPAPGTPPAAAAGEGNVPSAKPVGPTPATKP
jgi:hypothetical protein